MREPRPDWFPLGVNFKILDEHPYLFLYIESPRVLELHGRWKSDCAKDMYILEDTAKRLEITTSLVGL